MFAPEKLVEELSSLPELSVQIKGVRCIANLGSILFSKDCTRILILLICFFVFLFYLTLPCFDSVDVLAVFDVVDGSDDLVGGGGGERDARIDEDDENDVVEGIDVLDVEESLSLYQSTEEES